MRTPQQIKLKTRLQDRPLTSDISDQLGYNHTRAETSHKRNRGLEPFRLLIFGDLLSNALLNNLTNLLSNSSA
jgi:hypothetical protein